MNILALAAMLWLQTLPALPEPASVSGQIQLPDGRPASDIRVFAIPADSAGSSKAPFRLDGVAQTDRTGRFRFENLPATRHYIAAGPLEALTYYPGATNVAGATVVAPADTAASGALDFGLDASTVLLLNELKDVPPNPGSIPSSGKKVDARTKLERLQTLQVEWGSTWWAARIEELLSDEKVKIHYLGWDSTFDEIVPRSRLQLDDKVIEKTQQAASASNARLAVIERTQVLALPSSVIFDSPDTLPSRPPVSKDPPVPPNAGPIASTGKRVKSDTPLKKAQVLQVESGGKWWAAKILSVDSNGRVKIHYLGWDSSFDETVPRSRLQLDDNAIEKTVSQAAGKSINR